MSKIAFVNTLKVPSGEASVNRILSLAKGLVECGDEVHILSSAVHSKEYRECQIDGITVHNYGLNVSGYGLFQSLRNIVKKIGNERYDYVVVESSSSILIWSLFFTCKRYGCKYSREVSEFPFVMMRTGLFAKIHAWINVHTIYKLFDAIFIMTTPLVKFFQPLTRRNCRILHLPMTVDTERFNITRNDTGKWGRYVAYCGDMSGNKDGVENLIHSFGKISANHPDVKLLLIGGASTLERIDELKKLVEDNGYDNIIFYGRVSRDQMPQLLKNAEVLALARPSSLQSTGGFPTKLGEYLSTGNVVVVTAVGDIPEYLNEHNSYIVAPDDNDKFSEALNMALSNREESQRRGENGKRLADTVFNFRVQSRRLHDFIK